DGNRTNATGVQIAGVLDDLYATDAELGAVWLPAALPATPPRPKLRLWAPTAKSVSVHLYDGPTGDPAETVTMTNDGGVWSVTGEADWNGKYYLYEVEVYVPSLDAVEINLVTDPYSVSLARNSTRSQIVDLADSALAPAGWSQTAKPPLGSFEEASVYELHVRDFSIRDDSVPAGDRGTFAAFTHGDSDGMAHLSALADAGLTHIHLLPVFDIATINEDRSARTEPDWATLESFPPDSDQQQALISPIRDEDGFNWGYDPFHYTVPEGSYSTDPDGPARITEFREMVQSLNGTGLRVVMDVVYNHTNAAGQDEKSVLDRIVPGYYHRLDEAGAVTTSTCCSNTATEHAMMGKLMVDSVVTWARQYKVDGFRFDLMGHHSKANMLAVRAALDELTEADDGVDGAKILIYGEGWNFGEVADNARFVQASQLNMGGTGIATFSDRLRDAVRGGGPFDGGDALVTNQGWVNGLWYDPNAAALPESEAKDRLLLAADQIRVGLAGNLADYEFVDRTGSTVTGSQVDYNGSPAGYTADPQENVVYIAAHDNQTLFDIGQYHHPLSTSTADRARAQNVGNAVVALAQGLSFYHAGQDMLRSKSMDRDSYNSGDWFNRLDFTYQTNNWGAGLPVEDVNGDNWYLIQPRLADPALQPASGDIEFNAAVTREWLQIRTSTPLFSLATAAEVQDAVSFTNTGPDQTPGLIAMSITDVGNVDPEAVGVVVLFNPTTAPVEHTIADTVGSRAMLHPVLASSVDDVVRTASFDDASGTFTVPARTAAVFVVPEPDVTPPTVTAALELVQQRGRNGVYRVVASCVDTGGVAWADGGVVAEFSAELNGVPVTDGQELFLIPGPNRQKVIDNGPQVTIQAPSFELVVSCTDAWGNTTTERITP
ncbi:MAG: pullulanase-type alpha-1,6-glucosidase, partial [Acidimicrobiia bacterium]|nr:pullulanase-type alpha-1,6-glucosidase [Acidimicrobiia bacterium]